MMNQRNTKATILIVDDTPFNIHILAKTLINDYEVKIATNGPAALKIIEQDKKPDLILLDIMMPDMDGYEVCRRIKQNPSNWDIPVVFITAKEGHQDQKKGFDLGAEDYIHKPFQLSLVLTRIDMLLRLKRISRRLEQVALVDPLTELPNGIALEKAVEQELQSANQDQRSISLLMIDIDHFKAFNDHYGHGAGNMCLRKVARTIESSINSKKDLLGRYSGAEFIVVLSHYDQDRAINIAEEICQNILQLKIPHAHSPVSDYVTISIGVISVSHETEINCSEMFNKAKKMLHVAKKSGRNRVAGSGSTGKVIDHE
jgi:diguanylate cyclase (GGDEF)-like protein